MTNRFGEALDSRSAVNLPCPHCWPCWKLSQTEGFYRNDVTLREKYILKKGRRNSALSFTRLFTLEVERIGTLNHTLTRQLITRVPFIRASDFPWASSSFFLLPLITPPDFFSLPLMAHVFPSPPHLWLTHSRPPGVMLVKSIKTDNQVLLLGSSVACTHQVKVRGCCLWHTCTYLAPLACARTHGGNREIRH